MGTNKVAWRISKFDSKTSNLAPKKERNLIESESVFWIN